MSLHVPSRPQLTHALPYRYELLGTDAGAQRTVSYGLGRGDVGRSAEVDGVLMVLGMRLFTSLWVAIKEYFPPAPPSPASMHATMRAMQQGIISKHQSNALRIDTTLSSSRTDVVRRVKALAAGPRGMGGIVVLTGPSGAGRTASLCRVVRELDIASALWHEVTSRPAPLKAPDGITRIDGARGFRPEHVSKFLGADPLTTLLSAAAVTESPVHFEHVVGTNGRYRAQEALRVRPFRTVSFFKQAWHSVEDAALCAPHRHPCVSA